MQRQKKEKPFNIEQVTKIFYAAFQAQRSLFLAAIQPDISASTATNSEHEQYATLLLNRLMFLYFLQKKCLLDNDINYLSNRLVIIRQIYGEDAFYRCFLLPLFHLGLNQKQRSLSVQTLLGSIPYLESSLFAACWHESGSLSYQIPDAAFIALFSFFEHYQWRLDESPLQRADELNPDILGYIFEQHVNQQQMGAYYTQEDVTMYIARNTIIPALFDAVSRNQPAICAPDAAIWQSLRIHPDRYIDPLWQDENMLLGETASEWKQRQSACARLRMLLQADKVRTVDDLITYNLDITGFACDTIVQLEDERLLCVFFECLKQLKIFDPTCGSGAFLLSALRVLVPLYEACFTQAEQLNRRKPHTHESLLSLEKVLERRPGQGRTYAILQWIVRHNLYGVDIMPEAIEICKLRLLLRLLAAVKGRDEIEPVTEIHQHILTGNVLLPIPSETDSLASWYSRFTTLLERGGFDVIIGNPPYVEYALAAFPYELAHFSTARCGNLYPCVVERSYELLAPTGRQGMILPLAAFATRNMQPFIACFQDWFACSWLSFYHFRPAMLFSGGKVASIPTAIYLAKKTGTAQRFSTQLMKWQRDQRAQLFSRLNYCQVTVTDDLDNRHYYPKFGQAIENAIMTKVRLQRRVSSYLTRKRNQNCMYYRSAGGLYWKVFVNFAWPYTTTSNKQCYFQEEYTRDIFVALFNSSLFWWYYTVTFDTFNLKDYMLFGFHFSFPIDPLFCQQLQGLCQQLMSNYQQHAQHLTRNHTGSYTIYARKAKPIIDAIDKALAQHYGFTEEEVNFIITYDLKYRMGQKDEYHH